MTQPPATTPASPNVRQRVPWLAIVGCACFALLPFGNAMEKMLRDRAPTAREAQQAELNATIEARRTRIVILLAEGDRCRPEIARELARALVFDGRSALAYADDYERRCGADPSVRRWGDASLALAHVHRKRPLPP